MPHGKRRKGTAAPVRTINTKSDEIAFMCDMITRQGHEVVVIQTGILRQADLKPHVSREDRVGFLSWDCRDKPFFNPDSDLNLLNSIKHRDRITDCYPRV